VRSRFFAESASPPVDAKGIGLDPIATLCASIFKPSSVDTGADVTDPVTLGKETVGVPEVVIASFPLSLALAATHSQLLGLALGSRNVWIFRVFARSFCRESL
jgi:hypothetical protein